MVYIFLDVDGVLNNKKYVIKQHKKYGGRYSMYNIPFDPKCLKNLHYLVKNLDYKIVISSSWRTSEVGMGILTARLMEYNIRLRGQHKKIKYDPEKTRGELINEWINEYKPKDLDRIIIIDDEVSTIRNLFADECILETNSEVGLTRTDVKNLLKRL